MKIIFIVLAVCCFSIKPFAQTAWPSIDRVKFFKEDSIIDATLSMDITKLLNGKSKPEYFPATFSCKIYDTVVTEKIRIIARGVMRRQICYMPPLKLDFRTDSLSPLYKLNSLKLVSSCNPNNAYDQLLLKEYLIYKMYNLITDKSFHVRLLNLSYEDSREKKKTEVQHAFLIEDVKEMAKRNDCRDLKNLKLNGQSTDRKQFTIFSIFEYMIGNTDWGVSVNHNTTLIALKKDSTARPFVVPFDFDYSGLVDAQYAVPSEGLEIENVRQRWYRGFPRTMEELQEVLVIYNQQKEKIYSLINNFELLTVKNRKAIIDYLDDFYKTINDPRQVKSVFIDNARKE